MISLVRTKRQYRPECWFSQEYGCTHYWERQPPQPISWVHLQPQHPSPCANVSSLMVFYCNLLGFVANDKRDEQKIMSGEWMRGMSEKVKKQEQERAVDGTSSIECVFGTGIWALLVQHTLQWVQHVGMCPNCTCNKSCCTILHHHYYSHSWRAIVPGGTNISLSATDSSGSKCQQQRVYSWVFLDSISNKESKDIFERVRYQQVNESRCESDQDCSAALAPEGLPIAT